MTPEQLRASILQYAVEGKLVKQNPSDEPASKLLKKIEDEKVELIKEGKIKKSMKLPVITDDEKPFDIPDNWEWVRLNDISQQIGDIDHKMPTKVNFKSIPYISPKDFTPTGIDYQNAKQIDEKSFLQLSKKFKPQKGDFIFPRYGTIGKIREIDVDFPLLVSYSCCVIRPSLNVERKYVYYGLQSKVIKDEINRYINKSTQPNVGLKSIQRFIFPLPPLEEQKRIVAKIKKLMPLVDEYAESYNRLQKIDNEFEDKLKQSVLQYAMEGKLVKQDPSDEPASELIKKIKNEKAELIKEGKIKKSKKLPVITDDEKPFDIPDSWEWVRLGNIFDIASSKRVMKKEWRSSGIPFYRAREIVSINKNRPLKDPIFIDKDTYLKKIRVSGKPNEGDILLTGVGTLGVPYIVPKDKEFYFKDGNIIWLKNFGDIDPKYLSWYVQCPYMLKEIHNNRGTTVGTLTIVRSKNLIIPLPPLQEQKRIVMKIKEFMNSVSKLSK